jgi:hypothetical protein
MITDMRRQGLKGWTITSALRPWSSKLGSRVRERRGDGIRSFGPP